MRTGRKTTKTMGEPAIQEQNGSTRRSPKAPWRRRALVDAFFIAIGSFGGGMLVGLQVEYNLSRQMALLSLESRVAIDVRCVTEVRAFREAIQANLSPTQRETILARVKAGTRSPQVTGSQRGIFAAAIYGPDPALARAIRDDMKELLPDRKPTP